MSVREKCVEAAGKAVGDIVEQRRAHLGRTEATELGQVALDAVLSVLNSSELNALGDEGSELVRAIHCVASGEAQQSGRTLDQDEVEILSSLLSSYAAAEQGGADGR